MVAWEELIGYDFILKIANYSTLIALNAILINFCFKKPPKPIFFQNYKIQDISSSLCGVCCMYFFYLIEKENYNDAVFNCIFNK